MRHWLSKLCRTVSLLSKFLMARMFGEYVHSGWNGQVSFARYRWRGEEWLIPTGPLERDYSETPPPQMYSPDGGAK